MNTETQASRVCQLNQVAVAPREYVLYWMQQSQRAVWNHALEYAIERANELKQPLLVCFGLTHDYPEANLRHYAFMLEGLREVGAALEERGIAFTLQEGDPAEVALKLGHRASLIVCDRGYLAPQKAWRRQVAESANCAVVQVESDVVVPVKTASDKAEFAASTLRWKLRQLWPEHLQAVAKVALHNRQMRIAPPQGTDWRKPENVLRTLRLDHSVAPVTEYFQGGTSEAVKIFRRFCSHQLHDYKNNRNQPQTNSVSHMSKYLHFGQISPVWLALEVRKHAAAGTQNVQSFIDELLVRRELSMNWVEFSSRYAHYESLPEWARATLADHAGDRRPFIYSRAHLEAAETHDPYWNAAMREMRFTGYMHNHMRMYWGKKILEWTAVPEEAHATALAINNRYFLDGRDANSFANIAWIFGQHDRPWPERLVFGKVRYMNAAGLERKCDIGTYVANVDRLVAQAQR
jgi:deoxyribodipyrimidine photo-lyase